MSEEPTNPTIPIEQPITPEPILESTEPFIPESPAIEVPTIEPETPEIQPEIEPVSESEITPIVPEILDNPEITSIPKVIQSDPVVIQEPKARPVETEETQVLNETNPVVSSNPPETLYGAVREPVLVQSNQEQISIDPLDKISLSFKMNMLNARSRLPLALAAVHAKMMKKVNKLMTLFLKHKKIKNRDARDFLHVHSDTATNYLNILVKEKRIKREGKGKGTYYTKL